MCLNKYSTKVKFKQVVDTGISRMLTTGVIVRVFVVDKYSDIAVLKRFSKSPFSISNSFDAYSLRATACVFC